MFVSLLMGNKEFNIPFSFPEEEIEKLQVGDYIIKVTYDEPLNDEEIKLKEDMVNWYNQLPEKVIMDYSKGLGIISWNYFVVYYLAYQDAEGESESFRDVIWNHYEGQAFLGYKFYTEKELISEIISLYLYDDSIENKSFIDDLDMFYQPEKYENTKG